MTGTNDSHRALPKYRAFDSVEALNASMRNLLDDGGEAGFDEVFTAPTSSPPRSASARGKGIPSEFVAASQDLSGNRARTPQSLTILQGYARRLREFGFSE